MIFFVGKNASAFASWRGLRMPAIFAFSFGGFVGKGKVSLQTELRLEPKLFSTKMPPLRGWGQCFSFERDPRR